MGASCNIAICIDFNNCSSNGICVSPNECQCYDQYDGADCSQEVRPNLNTPVFANMSYTATVLENRQRGFHVLTIFANDSDPGKSGGVTYGIVETSIIFSYFILDRNTGRIVVASDNVLDYENLVQTSFVFTVTATDDGIPTKSSEATVTITVTDENDNCPVFQTTPGNYKIPLIIVARDKDSNRNGHIEFYVDDVSDPDDKFYIDRNSTELLARKILQPGAYPLTIVARDLGDSPCIRELRLTVIADELVPTPVSMTAAIQIHPSSSRDVVLNFTQLTPSVSISKTTTGFTNQRSTTYPFVTTATSSLAVTSGVVGSHRQESKQSAISKSVTIIQPFYTSGAFQGKETPSSEIFMVTATIVTAENSPMSTSPLLKGLTGSTVGSSSSLTLSKTSSSTNTHLEITIRLTNKVFVPNLADENSAEYKTLQEQLENGLKPVLETIEGFVKISSVKFREGSVIVDVQVEFKQENTAVTYDSVVRAIINASDPQGNIGQLIFDILFLERSLNKTTSGVESNDGTAFIVKVVMIGFAGLCFVTGIVIMVSSIIYIKFVITEQNIKMSVLSSILKKR